MRQRLSSRLAWRRSPLIVLRTLAPAACLSLLAVPLQASGQVRADVNLPAGPLSVALRELARQSGAELLYDHELVGRVRAPSVRGSLTAEAALRQLLAGSGLHVRRAQSGAFIVQAPDATPTKLPDAVLPELLVVGQRTQNADIRRFETDVQPYRVATGAEITASHRDTIDQFVNSRITSNTQAVPPSLNQAGDVMSEINLRGLGSESTLVLVDGRRLPSIPISLSGFRQANVNGIPLHSIARMEILTGAAGGIHGFGALGGVVNVVIDRERQGLDVHLTGGITSRGDAPRQAVELGYGFRSDAGTALTLHAAYDVSGPLRVGQRSFATRDRQEMAELAPHLLLSERAHGNSISLIGFGDNLVFKPEFGGATLPSRYTFLPASFSGTPQQMVGVLTESAGKLDTSISKGEAGTDLGSRPRTAAVIGSLRHRFSPALEAYFDGLLIHGEGLANDRVFSGGAFLAPESSVNPFTDYVSLTFPVEGLNAEVAKRTQTTRYTAGFVFNLPRDWRAAAEATVGAFRYDVSSYRDFYFQSLFLLGDASDPDVLPWGDWEAFQAALGPGKLGRYTVSYRLRNRYREQSVRVAGPLVSTAAGAVTLTLLGARRSETVPAYTQMEVFMREGESTLTPEPIASRSTATDSIYAELRAPLFGDAAPNRLLRELELQLALRRDEQTDDFAIDPRDPDGGERRRAEFSANAYTAGVKTAPADWLLLRTSYATGAQPPDVSNLLDAADVTETPYTQDPRRGGISLGADGPYLFRWQGNPALSPVNVSTFSLGAVIGAGARNGPRFSIDYSRLRRSRDYASLTAEVVLANEAVWPERVTRGPLTAEDQAKGYTAGPVTVLDTRGINGGTVKVDTIDARLDWPTTLLDGRLRLYGDATYHIRNVQKWPFRPGLERAGSREGPLRWRANAGADWSRGPFGLGANIQYFSSYAIQSPYLEDESLFLRQGGPRVPAQAYLDLHASWRLSPRGPQRLRSATIELGVINVFDTAPPRQTSSYGGPGYSRYGDPRQRRFELVISGSF